MTALKALIRRNTKLFFKDKGMFFTALITPAILLVLYATFLGKIYRDSFMLSIPEGFSFSEKLIDATVGGQLISSILAVSCVTVAFCSNMLMVQDKATGNVKDLTISPLKPYTMSLGYYLSALVSTLLICFAAAGICLGYIATLGWYMSVSDILLLLLDIFLLVMFGTVLSSIINFFLSTQGQIAAVGTVVSSVYGFICGAYMPISQFSEGLQNVIMFLPGTYGTALLRRHAMNGVFTQMESEGFPPEAVKEMQDAIDCNLYFFDNPVSPAAMYTVLGLTVAVLVAVYILMNIISMKKKGK